ncbi:Fibroblast growth factor receptor 4 [Desmophyllum pertusum]|uniref:Fibroblast growth factor receptor 4 n=1 Tax=Desmophyllum pertusum TaxID=174260 RepID=A0A9W9YLC2_9CNID|nr:Fibroblast growth factor receptor 4 [Desmophyllum pertusum]
MILRFLSKALLVAVLGLLLINEGRTKPCSGPFIWQKLQNLTTVVAYVGKDVMLPCRVKDVTLLHWLKNNKTLDLYPNMRVKFNRYLKIKRVRKEDAGFYTCVAENECGNTDSFTWKVSLKDNHDQLSQNQRNISNTRPRFTVSPHKLGRSHLAVPVGNSIKLDCSAEGHPRPTVRWYKDGALFQQRKGGRRLSLSLWTTVLTMKELVPTDSGKYICNVSNTYGWINHTYVVDVRERIIAEPVILPMENVTVYEGENATLLCKAISDSMPYFQWLRWFTSSSNGSANGSKIEHPHYEVIKQNDQDTLPRSRNKFVNGVKLTLVIVSRNDAGKYAYKQVVQSVSHLDDIPTDSGQEQESEKSGIKTSKASRFQYPKVLIGMLAGVVVLLIIAFGLCYWQIKSSRRAYSSTTMSRRPEIDSLRAKYEVQNEYVVVPDFKSST